MRPMTLTVYLAHTTPLSNSKGFAYNAACSNFLFYNTPPTCTHTLASKPPHSSARQTSHIPRGPSQCRRPQRWHEQPLMP